MRSSRAHHSDSRGVWWVGICIKTLAARCGGERSWEEWWEVEDKRVTTLINDATQHSTATHSPFPVRLYPLLKVEKKKKKSSTEAQSSSNSAANMLSRTFVSPWRNTGGEVQIDQLGFYFSSRVFLIIDSEYVCKFLNFWCQKCSKLLLLHWSCTTFRSAPLMVSVLKITKKYKLTPLDVCEIYAFMSLSPVHNSEEYHPPTSSQKHPSQVPSSSQVAKGFEFKY